MSNVWEFGSFSVLEKEKRMVYLEFPTIEEKIPVFLLHGKQEGPTILVMAGIHGCEYTSIDAALTLGRELDPHNLKGQLVIVPIANPASFYARSIYVHPRDQKNLNRVFPGKKDGSDAERLAYWLNEELIKNVDYVIDLHGGDMIEALIPFTIYHMTKGDTVVKASKELASLYDTDYVIGSKGELPGSTYGSAAEQGIPAIIAEAGQQGILSKEESERLVEGTKNVLRSLHILEGEVETKPSIYLETFHWYRADYKGLWYPEVQIGNKVSEGDLLGVITDEFGNSIYKCLAKNSGVVLFLVTSLAINVDDPLLAIGN